MPDRHTALSLDELRRQLLLVVREHGYRYSEEPYTLASGELSHDFIDGKAALANGRDLELACQTILALADDEGIDFDAVGGLTMGADHFSHGVALLSGRDWFTVRKQPKGRGTNQRIEGRTLGDGVRVLLVDDVVTTGGSIQVAFEEIRGAGAQVVLATTLVDRGEVARRFFERQRTPYRPIFTYRDLGIEPVGGSSVAAASR